MGRKPIPKKTEEEKRVQKAEPSLKKESPNLEICLLFITLISKNLAGLSVQTVVNRKINCHRSFNGAGRLE